MAIFLNSKLLILFTRGPGFNHRFSIDFVRIREADPIYNITEGPEPWFLRWPDVLFLEKIMGIVCFFFLSKWIEGQLILKLI